jgi:hypothetical protein
VVADDGWIARLLIERLLGAIYLVAFVIAARQFPALCGERGLERSAEALRFRPFRAAPSLFWFGYSDRRLRIVAGTGTALSAATVLGIPAALPLPLTMLVWLILWALYLSIVNAGGTFYAFGWESQLCEAGFLAIFLGNTATAPALPVLLLFRWLGFRVEFGAGLIKLRGDPCWRALTCMDHHHETQPLPGPLSWYAHHAPGWYHRGEALGNFVAQLVLPFGLFLPQPVASIAAAGMIGTQLYLITTGNYAFLNWVTIAPLLGGLSDSVIRTVLPFVPTVSPAAAEPQPAWSVALVVGLVTVVAVLSIPVVRNLASSRQLMNYSWDPLRLVGTYGAFGSVTTVRHEVVVEGTEAEDPADDDAWHEYGFKGKPGDVDRRPPQVAPYHLRLDWLLWFIPISPGHAGTWFEMLLARLLTADRPTLALLRRDPFDGRQPAFVRARLFRYRFTTPGERRQSGAWWHREPVGVLIPPSRLGAAVGSAGD